MSVAELKAAGNAAFAKKDYQAAIQAYSDAIQKAHASADDADKQQAHVLYSNRSACHAGLKQWDDALDDAEQCIKINPSFAKGYGRKGSALHGARRYDDSIKAYEEGIKIAPSDAALKKGLEEVQRAADSDGPGMGMGKMFQDPQLHAKLAANPKTAPLLADPSFMAKLSEVQRNPSNAMQAFQDPRMLTVMGMLMGIDLQAFQRPEGSDELPEELESRREEIERQTKPGGAAAASASKAPAASSSAQKGAAGATPAAQQQGKDSEGDVTMEEAKQDTAKGASAKAEPAKPSSAAGAADDGEEEEASAPEDKEAKAKADAEKAVGNKSYLARDFAPAVAAYQRAWELYPRDITYLNNLAAAHFEAGDLESCVSTCDKAVEEGRKLRADYKLVAKALGRKGNALLKLERLDAAIDAFQRSLTEHRTPEVLTRLRDTEKALKEQQRRAYIDPAKAEEERNRGNELYKQGDFAGAVAAYTEATKRNPDDAKGFTNRASAYLKLMALSEGLKDCDEAIRIDPQFVKAYIRKAQILNTMKEHTKALEAITRAADLDASPAGGNKNAREIRETESKVHSALYQSRAGMSDEETLAQAMRDPEVASIMADPVMQSILQQAQSDPRALVDHMKNPEIRGKVQKLVAAGIIKTR